MITIYGIKNCDTMKKAFRWLDDHHVSYHFHDYKKQGIDRDFIQSAINHYGWEVILNKRGTSWRQLPEDQKQTMNNKNALDVAAQNPSILKRPIVKTDTITLIGFSPEEFSQKILG